MQRESAVEPANRGTECKGLAAEEKSEKRLRIGIASMGRFHVLNLAVELDRLGQAVRFYSFVPKSMGARFGLRRDLQGSVFWFLAPLVWWARRMPQVLRALRERMMAYLLNFLVILRMRRCDAFIFMSGTYLGAARFARWRFGASLWMERGSKHILAQDAVLRDAGAIGVSPFMIARELAGYELADRICVAAPHIVDSFENLAPHLLSKVIENPYGVDIAQFPVRTQVRPRASRELVLVTAGSWCKRKGSDLLMSLLEHDPDLKLVHLGPIGDLPASDHPRIRHVGVVEQEELAGHYWDADVYVQASREEGLAVVQAQALAAGLPLLCTRDAGGAALGHTERLRSRIVEVSDPSVEALSVGLAQIQARIDDLPSLGEEDRQSLTWGAYGERYLRAVREHTR